MCSVEDCSRPAFCKGLCQGHYNRQYRGASVALPLRRRDEQRQAVLSALVSGMGLRGAARATGASKGAVARVMRETGDFQCPCGQSARHKGWCSWRFSLSPGRQEWWRKIEEGRRQRAAAAKAILPPISEHWPFLDRPLDDEHRILVMISSAIPRGLSEEVRQEVGQDIALALYSGEIQEADLGAEMQRFVRAAYRRLPSKYILSLDCPMRGNEGRTLGEMVADLKDAWGGERELFEFRDRNGERVAVKPAEPGSVTLTLPDDDYEPPQAHYRHIEAPRRFRGNSRQVGAHFRNKARFNRIPA